MNVSRPMDSGFVNLRMPRKLSFVVVGTLICNFGGLVWVAAGYHFQMANQEKRLVALEEADNRQTGVLTDIKVSLARMDERLGTQRQTDFPKQRNPYQ